MEVWELEFFFVTHPPEDFIKRIKKKQKQKKHSKGKDERNKQHIITEAAPNELKLVGGA